MIWLWPGSSVGGEKWQHSIYMRGGVGRGVSRVCSWTKCGIWPRGIKNDARVLALRNSVFPLPGIDICSSAFLTLNRNYLHRVLPRCTQSFIFRGFIPFLLVPHNCLWHSMFRNKTPVTVYLIIKRPYRYRRIKDIGANVSTVLKSKRNEFRPKISQLRNTLGFWWRVKAVCELLYFFRQLLLKDSHTLSLVYSRD